MQSTCCTIRACWDVISRSPLSRPFITRFGDWLLEGKTPIYLIWVLLPVPYPKVQLPGHVERKNPLTRVGRDGVTVRVDVTV